ANVPPKALPLLALERCCTIAAAAHDTEVHRRRKSHHHSRVNLRAGRAIRPFFPR
ncbi:unnamed protein product, partial [Ascophyllum nodosum]